MENHEIIMKLIKIALRDYKLTKSFRFLGKRLKTKYGFPYYFKSLIKKEFKLKSYNDLDLKYVNLLPNILEIIELSLYENEKSIFSPIIKETHLYIFNKIITEYEVKILDDVNEHLDVSYETIGNIGNMTIIKKALNEYKFYSKFSFLPIPSRFHFGFCHYIKFTISSSIKRDKIIDELRKDRLNYTSNFWYVPVFENTDGLKIRYEHLKRTLYRLKKENFDSYIENLRKGNIGDIIYVK